MRAPHLPIRSTVYPRGCGGATVWTASRLLVGGLSPRVRGSPLHRPRAAPRRRSIPAGAGEPPRPCPPRAARRVYPRGCGGAPRISRSTDPSGGLSPRVRGSLLNSRGELGHVGSIPAGAGEPSCGSRSRGRPAVYPRGCGGAALIGLARGPLRGLSPRVRGSRYSELSPSGSGRSIPAGAGEPCKTV